MGEKRFRVLFYGQIAAGKNLEEVKRKLTTAFKITPEKLEDFFTGIREVVAREVDYYTAQKYRNAFEEAGARCTLVPEGASSASAFKTEDPATQKRPSPNILKLVKGNSDQPCYPRFVWQMYRVGDAFHCLEDDREDIIPFNEIALLAAFSYKEEDNRLKLMVFSRTGGSPYVADAKEIDYGDFLEVEEVTTAASLRKLIYRFCFINKRLYIDDPTAKFVQKGIVLSLDLEGVARYATSLDYSLQQRGIVQPPEPDEEEYGVPFFLDEEEQRSAQISSNEPRRVPSTVICPKCGLDQEKTLECMRCGTTIAKPHLRKRKTMSLGLEKSVSVPTPAPVPQPWTVDEQLGAHRENKNSNPQARKKKVFAAAAVAACLVVAVVALFQFAGAGGETHSTHVATEKKSPEKRSFTATAQPSLLAARAAGGGGKDDKTALTNAARAGDWEEVKDLLADGIEVNQRVRYLWPPLHAAAIGGHKQVVSLLLAHGAQVNAQHTTGETPLHCAASRGHEDVVKMLLVHGADVNARDRNGDTPLHFAAIQGYPTIATILLDNNAPIDAKNDRDATPLHFAATRGRLDTAALLIAKGADVNAPNRVGDTPLHCAAIGGHKEVAQMLVSQGAQVATKNMRGSTPQDCAKNWDHNDVAELLG